MKTWITIACIVMISLGCKTQAGPTDALKSAAAIPLEGVEGRIDHMAFDAANNRLYVAALGNDTVEVIDLKANKQSARIQGVKKPQGVAVITESRRLAVASGDDGKCRVYDESQKPLGTIDGLDDADNARYDPAAKLLYVGYGEGALAVIDPEKIRKLADIKLDGHPESFQLEATGNRIYVNVPTSRHVAVIDREKRAVVAKWELKDAQANFPMALDEANHRLFVGCRNPARILVLDTGSGKTVATVDCCGDTDDVFYDAPRKRIYVSGGEGCVSVIEQVDLDTYTITGQAATASGARRSFFIPATGTLYVAVPHRGSQRCELRVFNVTR